MIQFYALIYNKGNIITKIMSNHALFIKRLLKGSLVEQFPNNSNDYCTKLKANLFNIRKCSVEVINKDDDSKGYNISLTIPNTKHIKDQDKIYDTTTLKNAVNDFLFYYNRTDIDIDDYYDLEKFYNIKITFP